MHYGFRCTPVVRYGGWSPDALSPCSPEYSVAPFLLSFQSLVRSTGRLYIQYCHLALSFQQESHEFPRIGS
jgi:hypothetical protein